jgi:hypothetical protein
LGKSEARSKSEAGNEAGNPGKQRTTQHVKISLVPEGSGPGTFGRQGLADGFRYEAADIAAHPGEPARRPYEIAMAMLKKGFYVRYGGDTIQLAPPFISTPAQISTLLDALGETYGRQGPSQRMARKTLSTLANRKMGDIYDNGLHEFITEFIDDNNRLGSTISEQYLV